MGAIKREGIMLCSPFSIKRFESWGSTAILQPKLNGERCRIIWNSAGKVSLRSSYNNEIVSVPHIKKQLHGLYNNYELDGELYKHGFSLQKIQSIVSRTVNLHPEHESIELHVFDSISGSNQLYRLQLLRKREILTYVDTEKIKLVPYKHVDKLTDVDDFLKACMDEGYEGIVIRKIDGVYQRDLHSTQIMKLKPRKDDQYIIIGVKEEIDKYGNPKNSLGSFACKAHDVDEVFYVGTGRILTAEGRRKYWDNPPIGKILHIKYQELTPYGIPYAPVAFNILED